MLIEMDVVLDAPLAQGIGLVGALGGMFWPLAPGRTGMLLAQLFANLLLGAHYAMLGASTGAMMNALSAAQVAAAIPLGTRPGFRLAYLAMLPLVAAATVATWHGPASAFAAAGIGLISLARYQTDVVRLRVLMAAALPCWFGHNILVMSIPGMMSDVVGSTLNAVMLVRLLRSRACVVPIQDVGVQNVMGEEVP
jgi:hypothetical protein